MSGNSSFWAEKEYLLMHRDHEVLEALSWELNGSMTFISSTMLSFKGTESKQDILDEYRKIHMELTKEGLYILECEQKKPISLDDVLDKLSRLYKITPHAELLLNAEEQIVLYSAGNRSNN